MVSKLPTYVVNDFVSVPYRGATFLNIKSGVFERVTITFPSPIGELHFSIGNTRTDKEGNTMFPSPIGELHFSIDA